MEKKKTLKTIVFAAAALLICFALCATEALYSFDKFVTDPLYQRAGMPNNRIRILAIDEKTLAEYGNYADWSRDIPARLVEKLNEDPEKAPAVIAFDVMYVGGREAQSDDAFAAACARGGNVITAVNLVYRDEVKAADGVITVDNDHIQMVEYPYDALREASDYGFANTYLDADQYVRFARLCTEYEGGTIWSLPAAIWLKYAEVTGAEDRRQELFRLYLHGKERRLFGHIPVRRAGGAHQHGGSCRLHPACGRVCAGDAGRIQHPEPARHADVRRRDPRQHPAGAHAGENRAGPE